MEMKDLVLESIVLLCMGTANGHIHSQKIRHIERERVTASTWMYALSSSVLVGMCGVFPLLVNRWVRLDASCKESMAMRTVLGFAVGGLLGDVFLHLLPEAWGKPHETERLWTGLWVLCGLLTFMLVEKVVLCTGAEDGTQRTCGRINGSATANGSPNGVVQTFVESESLPAGRWLDKEVSGYLNLVANCTDNFTHGLAIAASYVASPMVGLLTTLAIICHEVPHEIGDFAILLNSGFDRRGAAKAQVVTACGGLVGVVAGLTAEQVSDSAAHWLLPFTAGGFLYIALVSILPDLLESTCLWECILQVTCVMLGIVVMALVTIVERKSCSYMPEM